MNCDASVLRVCWDADSLFRLASTKLPEERSATRTIVRLSALGFVKSLNSEDAVEDAVKNLHRVYGNQSGDIIRRRGRRAVLNNEINQRAALLSSRKNRRFGEAPSERRQKRKNGASETRLRRTAERKNSTKHGQRKIVERLLTE